MGPVKPGTTRCPVALTWVKVSSMQSGFMFSPSTFMGHRRRSANRGKYFCESDIAMGKELLERKEERVNIRSEM
jgi:hypothetical protein